MVLQLAYGGTIRGHAFATHCILLPFLFISSPLDGGTAYARLLALQVFRIPNISFGSNVTYAEPGTDGFQPLTTSYRGSGGHSRASLQSTPRAGGSDSKAPSSHHSHHHYYGTDTLRVGSPSAAAGLGGGEDGWGSPAKKPHLVDHHDGAAAGTATTYTMRSALNASLPRGSSTTGDRYAYTLTPNSGRQRRSTTTSPDGGRSSSSRGRAPPSPPAAAAEPPTSASRHEEERTADATRRLQSLLHRTLLLAEQQREKEALKAAFSTWQERTEARRSAAEAASLRRQLAGARINSMLHARRLQTLQRAFGSWQQQAAAAAAASSSPRASASVETSTDAEAAAAAAAVVAATAMETVASQTTVAGGCVAVVDEAPTVRRRHPLVACVSEVSYFLFWLLFFSVSLFGAHTALLETERGWQGQQQLASVSSTLGDGGCSQAAWWRGGDRDDSVVMEWECASSTTGTPAAGGMGGNGTETVALPVCAEVWGCDSNVVAT